jgi:octaprenyl-diphosphate synthase
MSILDSDRIKLLSLQKIISPELKRFDAMYDDMMQGVTPLMNEVCEHIKKGKSKRFRPTLLLLSAKHDGPLPEETILAASCVEMIHTATLMHDDFIDEADTRRGLPSVNVAWSPAIALVMGDYLYSMALDVLARREMHDPLRRLAHTTVMMSQAEMMQLETKHDLELSEDAYLDIIYRKTGSLIESACAIGAGFNPGVAHLRERFGEFGHSIGMVFQITDDIFDYQGDARRIGKPTGQDWEEGRITLPLIAALRNAGDKERHKMTDEIKALADEDRKAFWPQLKAFVVDNGGLEYAQQLARKFGDQGKATIADVAVGAQKDLLAVSVEYVLKRLN